MNILAGTKDDGTIVRVKCDDNGSINTIASVSITGEVPTQKDKSLNDGLSQNVIYGYHEGHSGGSDDLHAIAVSENGEVKINLTSIETVETLNVSDTDTHTKLDTSNSNTDNLNNMVFGGSNFTLPTTSTLQNNLIYGCRSNGGTDDLHCICVNSQGHLCCNLTSIDTTDTLNCNITNSSIAITTSKTYSGPLTIFDTAGNQSSYTATSVDYDGDVVSLDGYDKFLLLCSLTAVVSNPGTFQILVSYDNITYYGLQTTSFDTAGNNLVAYPYYRLNGLFDNAKIVIGKGWGSGYNGDNTTPWDNFGYKYLKVRMNITGTSSNITNPYFEIIRLN